MEIILVWLGRGGLGFSLMTGRFLGVVPSQMLGGETWFNEFMIYYTEYTHNMRRREEEEEGGTGLFGCFCCLEREREHHHQFLVVATIPPFAILFPVWLSFAFSVLW